MHLSEPVLYRGRRYIRSGLTEFLIFPAKQLPEGQIFSVSYVYTDENGLEWGLADSFGKWVLMADVFLP